MANIYERCFIYSREQYNRIMSVNKKTGRKFAFGKVIINGIPKIYTDKLVSMDKAVFADSILLIKGDIRKIKYTEPIEN